MLETDNVLGESEWGGDCHGGCEDICHYLPVGPELDNKKEPKLLTLLMGIH